MLLLKYIYIYIAVNRFCLLFVLDLSARIGLIRNLGL